MNRFACDFMRHAGRFITTWMGGRTHVTRVRPGSACALAGVKAGDIITAIDKAEPASAEEFRSRLRRATVQGQAALSVRRGNQDLQVQVKFARRGANGAN